MCELDDPGGYGIAYAGKPAGCRLEALIERALKAEREKIAVAIEESIENVEPYSQLNINLRNMFLRMAKTIREIK